VLQRGLILIAMALLIINALAVYFLLPNPDSGYNAMVAIDAIAVVLGGILVAVTDK